MLVLFQCNHTTIHRGPVEGVYVRYVREDADVTAYHSSLTRAAIAMAKGGPCLCAEAWGRLRLLRKAT